MNIIKWTPLVLQTRKINRANFCGTFWHFMYLESIHKNKEEENCMPLINMVDLDLKIYNFINKDKNKQRYHIKILEFGAKQWKSIVALGRSRLSLCAVSTIMQTLFMVVANTLFYKWLRLNNFLASINRDRNPKSGWD